MADIAVYVSGISPSNPLAAGKFNVDWGVVVDGDPVSTLHNGFTEVSFDAPNAKINLEILNNAVAVALAAGFSVGPNDRKTLFAGAVGF